MAAADRRPGRGGERRRPRARRRHRRVPTYLRHGPAQPREQRRDPRVRRPGRALGRRHVHERPADDPARRPDTPRRRRRPSPSCTRTSRRTRTNCSPTRATSGRSSRTTRASTTTTTSRPARPQSVSGHFIQVPKNIATGKNPDGSEIKAADVGLPAPTDGRQLAAGPPHVGSARHRWSAVGARVLEPAQQRLRLRPRRGHRVRQASRDGQRRLRRGLGTGHRPAGASRSQGRSTNGRVWKMVLDPDDPTKVDSLSVVRRG